MRQADIIGALISIFFGVFVITQALGLEYWWRFGPGPGFVPLWSGVLILSGGVLLFITSVRRPPDTMEPVNPEGRKRLITITVLTVLAAVAMNYLGFGTTMFLFMALLVGGVGRHRWYVTLGSALLVSVTFYLVFVKWLLVPLPKGVFGF